MASKRKQRETSPKDQNEKETKKPTQILLIHRPRGSLSHWWRSLQILSFFLASLGGICACIAIGRLRNSFVGNCLLYAKLGISSGANLSDLDLGHISVQWGANSDCGWCEYSPMFGAGFAMLLSAFFLQCGKGVDSKAMTVNISWILVAPSIPIALIFFILSCVSLGNTVSGLLSFCSGVIERSHSSLNITSCPQVYQLAYPYRSNYGPTNGQADIDRYSNFLIAEIGASIHFVGWFLALFILLIRCWTHADFHVLKRKQGPPVTLMKMNPTRMSSEYLPFIVDDETETLI